MPNIYTVANGCADEVMTRTAGYMNTIGVLLANQENPRERKNLHELYKHLSALNTAAEETAKFCKNHVMPHGGDT
ncbi:MAG: hypothetical protein MJ014_00020 [Methanocorpusculum sp.]|nr:hypothetical protein [Methanocorpusculum sp.]